jgi:hypothetical protein
MKLEGGERLVLKTLLGLQGDSTDYVEDVRLASVVKMLVNDVRDWMETLEGKGLVERARGIDGFSAYVTAKGKQTLRLTEPISGPVSSGIGVPYAMNSPSDATISSIPARPDIFSVHIGPITLFYSYSHRDEPLRDDLEESLALLKRQRLISSWHDRMIGAGDDWKGEIDKNLEEAQIILLLVSSSFLASDYCWDVETKRAIERHDRGEAKVIPIILRPCDWRGSLFGKLQALPRDAKAVTSWTNRDEAWTDVARGIRSLVERI